MSLFPTQNEKKINPYAIAISNCLNPILEKNPDMQDVTIDDQTAQFLTNMVQGRLLQYLVSRIASNHMITDIDMQKKLMMNLMNIFCERFFGIFRENVKADPMIVFKVAKLINRNEVRCLRSESKRLDMLYLWIFRKYFEYEQVDGLLRIIEYHPEVRKIILIAKLQETLQNVSLYQTFCHILQQDTEGIMVRVFSRYLNKNKVDRLIDLIQTGDWKIEANYLYNEVKNKPQCLIID